MRTDELDFDLPDGLIATTPATPRDAARLLVIRRETGQVSHHHVRDLPDLGVFRTGDLMLVNQSRVLPARFEATRAATGGHVGGLYLGADANGRWEAMLESGGKLREGEALTLDDQHTLTLEASLGRGRWALTLQGPQDTLTLLTRLGHTPLPPYIRKARKAMGLPEEDPSDRERYNTLYSGTDARTIGSVAAPTAGLHFTPELLTRLQAMGVQRAAVTLHVGLGTFAPVRTDRLEDHAMHSEPIHIPAATLDAIRQTRAANGRIWCVGTTTVRAVESLPDPLPTPGESFTADTRLFILPGFAFRHTDLLMTNFHLPQSTLLALVAALPGLGLDRLLGAYREAIAQGYRFYSYGDAMLIV